MFFLFEKLFIFLVDVYLLLLLCVVCEIVSLVDLFSGGVLCGALELLCWGVGGFLSQTDLLVVLLSFPDVTQDFVCFLDLFEPALVRAFIDVGMEYFG